MPNLCQELFADEGIPDTAENGHQEPILRICMDFTLNILMVSLCSWDCNLLFGWILIFRIAVHQYFIKVRYCNRVAIVEVQRQEADYFFQTPIADNIGSCADDDATPRGKLSFWTGDV